MTGAPGVITRERLRRVRLIVSDMDGTLLNGKNELPEITRGLIERLETQTDVAFALGTGRPRVSAAPPFAAEFNFYGRPGIFLNGAQVHGLDGALVSRTLVSAAAVQATDEALAAHRPHRVTVVLCAGDKTHLLAAHDDHAFSYYLAAKYNDPVPSLLSSALPDKVVEAEEGVEVNMITVLCRDSAEVRPWLIPEVLEGVAKSHGLALVNSLPNLVSLLPPGVSKAEGVRVLAKTLGLTMDQVAVVGDAHNDLEMLELAAAHGGLAVAVDNAMVELKEVAHLVVNHHDHDQLPGVAQLITLILDAKLSL